MKKYAITFAILFLMFSVLIAEQLEPQTAPLNPEYVKYLEALRDGKVARFTSDGYPLGYIPSPLKLKTEVPEDFDRSRIVPDSYDLRDEGFLTTIRNQLNCGSCWTFATYGSIESRWLKLGLGAYDLSENNLNHGHGFEYEPCEGGNSPLSTAYLIRGDGPISEDDDPYEDTTGTYHPGLTPVAYVTDARFLPDDSDVIKQIIYDYGALYTSLHVADPNAGESMDEYFNYEDNTFYYDGDEGANHAVTLVGWDDNKVVESATGNGAWIIRNSWGSNWGEDGYFYVSYYDTKINSEVAFWPNRIAYNPKATVHFYDKLGAISSFGWEDFTDYGLVKYITSEEQEITKLGTWMTSSNSVVSFEIYDDFDRSNLSNLLGSIGDQTCDYAGYYTFDLSSPIEVSSENDIYIKVKYNTPDNVYSIPIEYVWEDYYADPEIESGKCWVSSDGSNNSWSAIGIGTDIEYDLCIKAYGVSTAALNSIINIEPKQWYYGPVLVGSSENRLFVISNLGLGTLEVSNIDFTGIDANLFSIESGDAPFSLNTSGNHYIEVSFTPNSEGEKSAIMQIWNNDPSHNPLDVQLSGTGTTLPHPVISIDPIYWDFGLVPLGENREKIFTIKNNAPRGSGQDLDGKISVEITFILGIKLFT